VSNVEKVSVALTAEMADLLRSAVRSGEYASASEVMREALRDWKARRALRLAAVEEIGRLWDQGIGSGPAADGEEAFERIAQKLHARISLSEGP